MGTFLNPTWSIVATKMNCQYKTRLRPRILGCLLAAVAAAAPAQTVVFQEPGFPAAESEAVPSEMLRRVFPHATSAGAAQLGAGALDGAKLLVLPYGSALPVPAWDAIEAFLGKGGNLLVAGGEPGRVPVTGSPGAWRTEQPQDTYARALGFKHSYPVPHPEGKFAWRDGYGFLPPLTLRARAVFAEEGRLDGLGYLTAPDGIHTAAPVIFADRPGGGRTVALPFTPEPGWWASADGVALLRTAAAYAEAGPRRFSLEVRYTALRPGEVPEITAHFQGAGSGKVEAELLRGGETVARAQAALRQGSAPLAFTAPLAPGVYTLRASWMPAQGPGEFAENGFTVEAGLAPAPRLASGPDTLTLAGKPFLPVGTNYFTTEENGWDFAGPRNGAVWERDFARMERLGINFVRTGVWMGQAKVLDPATGEATERFLRNLEGYLAAAHRHGIAVNFTFFAFSPSLGEGNPYLDPATVEAEQRYVRSVVSRFHDVGWLSWDLINEPSFSNRKVIFHGNVPNGDPAELAAWRVWLKDRYPSLEALTEAWRAPVQSWDTVALPSQKDLVYDRYGNPDEVRALDYNLFAQAMFARWVRGMVGLIRETGSAQVVDVGQDEGGVTDRLLNQFYATAGVGFTTNHTYWQDGALLWDSVAAKRPGVPNITGETGYQPAWNPDGGWRLDELTGTDLLERKLALGFAAGSSGAVQWDWAREPDFGVERSDGSEKSWAALLGGFGQFARAAAPWFKGIQPPEVAIILPQSLQLSVLGRQSLLAQQTAVRVLWQHNRTEAYAVGEYQAAETLGTPKLIVLPSPYGLDEAAWKAMEARVRAGAVLLVTGSWNSDPHLHPTDRAQAAGLPYTLAPLQQLREQLTLPDGPLPLVYDALETTVLDKAVLPGGATWAEAPLGRGRILFSALPVELNSNLDSVARVYAAALAQAKVEPTYTTDVRDPGILICPTRLAHATLYVLTSETATEPVRFTDRRSGKAFAGILEAGRAALLLVREDGALLAKYNWP